MIPSWLKVITSDRDMLLIVIACIGVILLMFGKRILWFLFRFDRDVAKILHQKKSSEVRVGKIVESVSPFLSDFPVDVHQPGSSTQFIGQPVDFVHFTADGEIVFIEVKSGNAQLSSGQKKIKKAVLEGKVRWAEYRIK